MTRILDRYDAATLRDYFAESGTLARLERKGFSELAVEIDAAGRALPHTLVTGCKGGVRHVLLDAILGEAVVGPEVFARAGHAMPRPIELLVIHWLRAEDPTAAFAPDRPALPLQDHPGLGVLRSAFRVVVRIARELGKDGIANCPKFFHDAVIFQHCRLFLFLDGEEQGRFEALVRDLGALALGDGSLALLAGGVHDADGSVAQWTPGFLVYPLSPELADFLHAPAYAEQVARAAARHRFALAGDRCPPGALAL